MVKFVNTAAVVGRIGIVFDRYEAEAFKIFKFYAAETLIYFMQVQGAAPAESRGKYWTNHTFEAVQGFFAKAFQVPGRMGITLANTTSYARNLEEDYGGEFAAFPDLMERFYPLIIEDLKRLYGDRA